MPTAFSNQARIGPSEPEICDPSMAERNRLQVPGYAKGDDSS